MEDKKDNKTAGVTDNSSCPNPWAQFNGCGSTPYFGPGYDFPNQFQYQQDVGWLIQAYKYWICKYNYIAETVVKIEAGLDGLDQKIIETVSSAVQPVYQQIAIVRENMENLENRVNVSIDDMKHDLSLIALSVSSLESYVNTILPIAEKYADTKDAQLKQEIINMINSMSKEWPPVLCPVDGNMETINTALYHVYHAIIKPLIVAEFDNFHVTASQFDNMFLFVRVFNSWGYERFKSMYDSRFYMFSPITGDWMLMRDVIMQLYRLHYPDNVTAGELDGAKLTVAVFNAKNLTSDAFNTTQWV